VSDAGDPLHQEVPAHENPDVALSVVIPAFNEAQRLQASFGRLLEVVADGIIEDATTEFIVVDDGSTDGTGELARSLLAPLARYRILRSESNIGKGSAIRIGIQAAAGRHIVFIDADMAMDPSQIPLISRALEHSDLAIASRALPDQGIDYGNWARNAMGRLFNRLVNLMTGLGLEDTQCGLKGFRAPVARLLFHSNDSTRFAFDVEILALARKLGLSIAEVPVTWRNVAGSRIRPLKDPISMIVDVVRLRIGRLPATPIPVIAPARGSSAEEAASRIVGWRFPMARSRRGGVAILVPLGSDEEVAGLAAQLGSETREPDLVKTSTTYSQLIEADPYSLMN